MSFYGTVYHQVVDAFHKFFILNKGKDSVDFLSNDELKKEDGIENIAEASGINSSLSFSSGNNWIRLDVNRDEDKKVTNIDIYHNQPHSTIQTETVSKVYDTTETTNVTQLEQGAVFSIPSSKYDTAGHLISGEEKKYKLPVSDLELDVSNIQADVETLFKEVTDLDTLTNTNKNNISSNTTRIETLEEINIGSRIEAVEKETGQLRNDVGSVSEMYGSETQMRDLAKTIGSMSRLQSVFKDINNITIVQAIEENYDNINENANNLSITNILVKNHDDIISDLKSRIEALEKK